MGQKHFLTAEQIWSAASDSIWLKFLFKFLRDVSYFCLNPYFSAMQCVFLYASFFRILFCSPAAPSQIPNMCFTFVMKMSFVISVDFSSSWTRNKILWTYFSRSSTLCSIDFYLQTALVNKFECLWGYVRNLWCIYKCKELSLCVPGVFIINATTAKVKTAFGRSYCTLSSS